MSRAALLFALAIPLIGQDTSRPHTLAAMRDRYRPLLIFAPAGDPQLDHQMQQLTAHRSELIDRQVMLVPFPHKYAGAVDGKIVTFLNDEEGLLRRRFQVADQELTVILLGKDGGEKLRSHTPITMAQLNRIIDAMPMRQQEMLSRNPR